MLLNTTTRACRAKTWSGCMTAVLLLISILAAPAAWAHVDPPGSNSTGIGISLTAFRSDGTTPVLPGTLTSCETVYYRATLSWAGGTNAAFEGGAWSITTPDGVVHDVTPVGGVPCIGGTFDDPQSGLNGGRGLCLGAPSSINSALVPYTVDVADVVGGTVGASTNLGSAYAHISTSDQFGVGANTPFPLNVELCDDGLFCNGLETCDETGTAGVVTGICVPGTPPVCDNGLFCDGLEICDEGTDSCAPGTAPVCENGDFCDGTETCDEVTDSCAPGTPPDCAAEGDECNEGLCDEVNDICYTEPLPPETAPDVCFGDEICRTPGFWGARGGYDGDGFYTKGQNVTGAMLPVLVCGTLIDNTDTDSGKSAIEAICIKGGDPKAKMLRMLTSASLNCVLGDCAPATTGLIDFCNTACINDDSAEFGECASALGCFNEGGHINDDGSCVPAGASVCEDSGASCSDDSDCNVLDAEACVSYESCHDRMACPDLYDDGEVNGSDDCFEPLGAASSPKKCNYARQQTDYIYELPGWGTNP